MIADYETVCEPARLFDLIRSERVTLIELVPVVMKQSARSRRPSAYGAAGAAGARVRDGDRRGRDAVR